MVQNSLSLYVKKMANNEQVAFLKYQLYANIYIVSSNRMFVKCVSVSSAAINKPGFCCMMSLANTTYELLIVKTSFTVKPLNKETNNLP